MKNCQKIQADLSAYIDSELSPARHAEIQAHVAGCPDCRKELAVLTKLTAGVSALPQAMPAPQFLADVRRKIRQGEQPAESWVDKWLRPALPRLSLEVVAAIVVVAAVFLMMQPKKGATNSAKLAANRTSPDQVYFEPLRPSEPGATRILTEGSQADAVAAAASAPESGKDAAKSETAKTRTGDMVASVSTPAATATALSDPMKILTKPHPEPPETVFITGEELVSVKLRAEDLAHAMNGHLDSVTPSNTFMVSLPKSKVTQFRNQMKKKKGAQTFANQPSVSASSLNGGLPPASPAATTNKTNASKVIDPVVEVEVVVQPAESKTK